MNDVVIVGAGVIGLACARALAKQNFTVVILEAANNYGLETSSRNSDVIHAGIYHPQGSMKAKLCVQGKQQIYDYCEANNIAHKKIGKLIVANNEAEIDKLHKLKTNAQHNGIADLEILSSAELQKMEPHLASIAALFSPSSGILDTKSFMASLLKDSKEHGAKLLLNHKVTAGQILADHIVLNVATEIGLKQIYARQVINCGGLYASNISKSINGLVQNEIPTTYYRKGNYFKYNTVSPFKHLIYPIPVAGGLGTHGTINLQGELRFGPDVELVDTIDYRIDPDRVALFEQSIGQYYNGLQSEFLEPSYCGIRPALAAKGDEFKDFSIIKHRMLDSTAKFMGLYGIESPGLTACLAIANHVLNLNMVEENSLLVVAS